MNTLTCLKGKRILQAMNQSETQSRVSNKRFKEEEQDGTTGRREEANS